MKLPNAHLAVVDREKITEYLLNGTHPDNGGKATFFQGVGFTQQEWQVLAVALRAHAVAGEVSKSMESRHGSKYIVDGQIKTPTGRLPIVRSVWIVDQGLDAPRLVTAYPGNE